SLTAVKFFEGGWVTLLVTGVLVIVALAVKRHYVKVAEQLRRLDAIVEAADAGPTSHLPAETALDPQARTAIVLVNGYNGLGLHTALQVPRMFGNTFRNFVFLSVGSVDAGTFKGAAELDALRAHTESEANR